jgi:hypothetical protein
MSDATTMPTAKVHLFDQMMVVAGYVDRLEIHKKMAAERGETLGVMLEHELASLRQTLKTLELVCAYEKQFVALVTSDRERARRAVAAATATVGRSAG